MFAFHKPKIYRSVNGCCICKAKSSSSRFTDSKKYEPEFERCFRINEQRTGEICNACVLLVKRWKKLPAGTNRDWHHVVDVREKSVNKKPKAKTRAKRVVKKTKVIVDNMREQLRHQLRHTSGGLSDDVTVGDDSCSDEGSNFSPEPSRIASPELSDADSDDSGIDDKDEEDDDDVETRKKLKKKRRESKSGIHASNKRSAVDTSTGGRRKRFKTNKKSNAVDISPVVDMSFWKEEKICCGTIYRGPNGEVLICPTLLKPCKCRLQSHQSTSSSSPISEEELSEPGDTLPATVTSANTTSFVSTTAILERETSSSHSK